MIIHEFFVKGDQISINNDIPIYCPIYNDSPIYRSTRNFQPSSPSFLPTWSINQDILEFLSNDARKYDFQASFNQSNDTNGDRWRCFAKYVEIIATCIPISRACHNYSNCSYIGGDRVRLG